MRVALADDSVLFREGVARLLAEHALEVVAQAGTGDELVRQVNAHKPDVAIVDIRMPPTHSDEGLRAAEAIFEHQPGVGVILLSQHVDSDMATRLLSRRPEGVGYLLKDRVSDIDEFVKSVRRVADGGAAVDPLVVSRLLGRSRADDALAELTDREREVLEQMAQGRSNHSIAEQLYVSERTVESHVARIFRKLDLPDTANDNRRVLAVITYLRD